MNREELRAAMQVTAKEKPRAVEVKGWGTVYIRSLTVGEVDDQAEDTANKKDKKRIARAAARLLCDENGQRLFDHDNDEDLDLIAAQPWKLLSAVVVDPFEAEAKGN
ncbi:MAG: hypothetical protein ABI612_19185 [Betaproteobacteria bacterium]